MEDIIIEKHAVVNGLDVLITFNIAGIRCGYVGVPSGNKYYRESYEAINSELDFDAECTYANFMPLTGFDPNLWYIGFDCGHTYNGFDEQSYRKYFPDRAIPLHTQFMLGKPDTVDDAYRICVQLVQDILESCK